MLAADVAAAAEGMRPGEDIGVSDAVDRLIRDGLAKSAGAARNEHTSYELGQRIDVTDIGEVLSPLDEAEWWA